MPNKISLKSLSESKDYKPVSVYVKVTNNIFYRVLLCTRVKHIIKFDHKGNIYHTDMTTPNISDELWEQNNNLSIYFSCVDNIKSNVPLLGPYKKGEK